MDMVSRWRACRRGYLAIAILHSLEVEEGDVDQVIAVDDS